MKLIDKDALVAEIERLKADALQKKEQCKRRGLEKIMHQIGAYNKILSFLNTLEVKEIYVSNPRFPHLKDIIDKVFGAGNLESFEYEEAEQLVLLAKEELLKDLEVKEADLNKEIDIAMPSKYCWSGDGEAVYSKEQMRNFAKHFFELGMAVSNKAQKGE